MRPFIALLLSYLAAVPLTSRVSLDITKTEWTHLLTYVWIAFGWVFLYGIFFLIAAFLAVMNSR